MSFKNPNRLRKEKNKINKFNPKTTTDSNKRPARKPKQLI
jgi:hypothetical protein